MSHDLTADALKLWKADFNYPPKQQISVTLGNGISKRMEPSSTLLLKRPGGRGADRESELLKGFPYLPFKWRNCGFQNML